MRDFSTAMHALHQRAGSPSVRDIAGEIGLAHGTVHNVFTKPSLSPRDTAMAVAERLTLRVRWGSGVDPEKAIDAELNRLEQLWHRAWEAENPSRRPELPDATVELLHGLSPKCTLCHHSRQPRDIAPIQSWPAARRLALGPPGQDGTPSVRYIYDPWRLLVLCQHCQQRQHAGAADEQELRTARTTLDCQSGAARHYARFIDQYLTDSQSFDSVMLPALAIVSADPATHIAPYVIHGKIKVDRARGMVTIGKIE
ncbi:hypothetical protein ACFWZ2_21515 [Streptomyces sp. NPDC059002]|uniref:hypothetical protein n=1 Tax=Streptomyces sp. NPDC059002 TaxID=3346690 RepID=UPI0036A930FB